MYLFPGPRPKKGLSSNGFTKTVTVRLRSIVPKRPTAHGLLGYGHLQDQGTYKTKSTRKPARLTILLDTLQTTLKPLVLVIGVGGVQVQVGGVVLERASAGSSSISLPRSSKSTATAIISRSMTASSSSEASGSTRSWISTAAPTNMLFMLRASASTSFTAAWGEWKMRGAPLVRR